jgi:hypothetical protein
MEYGYNSTKHVLEGRELIDYLVDKASSNTNAELLRREEHRNRRMTALLSVMTFIGIGAVVGAIKLFVQQEITKTEVGVVEKVKTAVAEDLQQRLSKFEKEASTAARVQVDEQVGQVRAELVRYKNYQEFLALSEIIKAEVESDKIPEKQLADAIRLAEQLAEAESVTRQPNFLNGVKVVIDLLVRTDRKSEIDNLEQVLQAVLVNDRSISLDLVDHYGQMIISSPYPVEDMQPEFEAMSRYARSSREHKYPEKALMCEIFVAFKRNLYQATSTTTSMVETVQDLNEADTRNFCYQIFLNSHPLHWMNKPDQEGRELARLVTKLLENYPHLRQTVEAQIASPELRDSIENLIARKTERLARLQPEAEPVVETATVPEASNTLRR